jgi:hypothetical protein
MRLFPSGMSFKVNTSPVRRNFVKLFGWREDMFEMEIGMN